MENSSCDQTYNAGDLIWILRGDGMWWPAQVLSPFNDDLSEGSAVSGKPIKLLGKDVNESLDWYNLDKVEPFRSVEFIFWIALATLPSACKPSSARDVAIREALEIERVQQLRADESCSIMINSEKKEERVQHGFDLNIEYVPSDNDDMDPLTEEQSNKNDINKEEGREKRQRRRRRAKEVDDLLKGVGIELTTSKRKRKLLPHAREFLESCRSRRRRASKKLKAVSNHDSTSNEELKNDTALLLNEQSSQGNAASHKTGSSSSSHVETLINQNESDHHHHSSDDSDDNVAHHHQTQEQTMRARADEIPWDWNIRARKNFILRARHKSQACVPVNTIFIRLLKDLD